MLVGRVLVEHRAVGPSRTRGFSLLEALIALLVLSFGLLGMAAMQLRGLQSAHMAYQGSLANLAAIDAQERVWAYLATHDRQCPSGSALAVIEANWREQWLTGGLSDAGASGLRERGPCAYEVVVNWAEYRDGSDDDTFRYHFRLPVVP